MLVYANHLTVTGAGAEGAVFKAVGAWLKEQLGFGLHPEQMRRDGEFNGQKGELRSYLRVRATVEAEPALCSWVLKHADHEVRGREWITELGAKMQAGHVEFSCVVRTDEHSTMVAAAGAASQPRVVRYVVSNVEAAPDADLEGFVPGERLRTVGQDRDSYRGLLVEVERPDREGPILLMSPQSSGDYPINPERLQRTLIGLAQVILVDTGFDGDEMVEVLGRSRSAWGGAVNILFPPSLAGRVRNRLCLADEVSAWGESDAERTARALAWVTTSTNIPRLKRHIRPEGVAQLAARRQLEAVRANSSQMGLAQLRAALDEAAKRESEQDQYFDEIAEANSSLESQLARATEDAESLSDTLRKRDYEIRSLKEQLARVKPSTADALDALALLRLICQGVAPSPLECLAVIEQVYGERCTILSSARESAERMDQFVFGRELLDLLRRLVSEYRERLLNGGDSEARKVFGKDEYAAKESETVMSSKSMRRQRTFPYDGQDVEMFRHLKIGVADDVTRTIRVHFHWDAERELIVIGYCGKHLSVASH